MTKEFRLKISQSLVGLTQELARNWKGDEAGYVARHIWIKKLKGKPSYCEVDKRHFGKRYEWASISRANKRDVKDWIQMCPSCHRVYDKYLLSLNQLYERTAN